jgi:serine protease Do
LKFGEVVKAWIGLEVRSITPEIAHSLELERTRGLVISSVGENSPAAKAGLKPGDVPVSVGNFEMNSVADWDEIESYARAGQALGAKVMRGEKELSLVIIPEEIPTRLTQRKTDKFGLEVAEITPSVASYIGITNRQGVLVMGASVTSWAARWKLREGDIIRQVGRHIVKNLDDYVRTMEKIGKGYKIVFLIERGDGQYFVTVLT